MLSLSKLWTKLTWAMSGITGHLLFSCFLPAPAPSVPCTEETDTGFSPSLSFLLPGSVSESSAMFLKCRFGCYLEWWGPKKRDDCHQRESLVRKAPWRQEARHATAPLGNAGRVRSGKGERKARMAAFSVVFPSPWVSHP